MFELQIRDLQNTAAHTNNEYAVLVTEKDCLEASVANLTEQRKVIVE